MQCETALDETVEVRALYATLCFDRRNRFPFLVTLQQAQVFLIDCPGRVSQRTGINGWHRLPVQCLDIAPRAAHCGAIANDVVIDNTSLCNWGATMCPSRSNPNTQARTTLGSPIT